MVNKKSWNVKEFQEFLLGVKDAGIIDSRSSQE